MSLLKGMRQVTRVKGGNTVKLREVPKALNTKSVWKTELMARLMTSGMVKTLKIAL